MKSKTFKQVTLFVVMSLATLGMYVSVVPSTQACSMYDPYSCGSFGYSNYGDYYNYWPYPSTTSGCVTCGAYDPYFGGGFGYQYPTYQYQNYPTFQYVYNQPTYRPQNQLQLRTISLLSIHIFPKPRSSRVFRYF